ncbi:MAG TPA: gamma-glutamyl-gamma-aminobutyrate hydrolase family protein [Tepidisphaeraceae bacterium]|nr:gamma-glutamyl-gamma-aminobutyrate hydrolase family protein [Tepidisphaeraceae bacterium]
MGKPVIGITVDHPSTNDKHESPHSYTLAIDAAGGLPLLLPYRMSHDNIPQLVDLLDGVLFSGGNDLDPKSWNEPWHPQAKHVDPAREAFERALLAEIERRRIPAMGICLGSQLMNVARGGSMRQFIPDEPRAPSIEHRKLHDAWPTHPAQVQPGSLLHRIVGAPLIEVNSSHKQAMGRIGQNLRVVAAAPDGVVEALEDPSLPFFLGVQWHPERMIESKTHLSLFERLVEAAQS